MEVGRGDERDVIGERQRRFVWGVAGVACGHVEHGSGNVALLETGRLPGIRIGRAKWGFDVRWLPVAGALRVAHVKVFVAP